ncbi:MAG: RNA polymerase sigma factor RpoE [Laribacter sp.]|nr:RNA polymerase sigma factor RpoE [Laribacter sp.]MBP9528165.1 RNA polymerase sigma factor RpoE [Laribacter sp.]MBP9608873.1 RNA polymerase sigma factor RpoE [Laribacter sp.]
MNDREVDLLLVERARAGDARAFDLLVIKYRRKLARLLARIVRDPGMAEDVLQETFIKAFRALPQFRGDSAFYTWLYRIGVNTARNQLGEERHRPLLMAELESGDEENGRSVQECPDDGTPETELLSREIIEAVNRAMDGLQDDLRQAIALRELEGLSYEEIARRMNCPIGTVRSRIFRAREAIAAELRPLLDTPENKRW